MILISWDFNPGITGYWIVHHDYFYYNQLYSSFAPSIYGQFWVWEEEREDEIDDNNLITNIKLSWKGYQLNQVIFKIFASNIQLKTKWYHTYSRVYFCLKEISP